VCERSWSMSGGVREIGEAERRGWRTRAKEKEKIISEKISEKIRGKIGEDRVKICEDVVKREVCKECRIVW
jgi:hypothetical protein